MGERKIPESIVVSLRPGAYVFDRCASTISRRPDPEVEVDRVEA